MAKMLLLLLLLLLLLCFCLEKLYNKTIVIVNNCKVLVGPTLPTYPILAFCFFFLCNKQDCDFKNIVTLITETL